MNYTSAHDGRGAALRAALICSLLWLGAAATAFAAGTLDKAKESGRLTIGYAADAQPFSYTDAAGKAAGYAITLCSKVGDAIKAELQLATLVVDFVPMSRDTSFGAVEQGKVDLLCGAVPTLERRGVVDFSIPIMLSGTGAAVRADAPVRLVQVLSGREVAGQPIWRASMDQAPQRGVIAVVSGTVLEKALADRLKERRIVAEIVPVKDTAAGLQMLAARSADAFFGDRALLLDAAARSKSPADLVVLDRLFRRDLVALAMRRNDGDFRLVVDRALSRLYRSREVATIYTNHFGTPSSTTLDFFQLVALPD